jgi:hypothetical protein
MFWRYIVLGWRKAGDGMAVGEYVSNKKGTDEEKKLKEGIKRMMAHFERIGLDYIPSKDLSINNKLREHLGLHKVFLNGKKGRFSQIAIATGYWSPVHVDDDIFYTLLSAYCASVANKDGKDEILFYFLFPSVKIAIPVRNMDVLVFNSEFPHCASNYRKEDTITFSLFASAKTATAQMYNDSDLCFEGSNEGEVAEKLAAKDNTSCEEEGIEVEYDESHSLL